MKLFRYRSRLLICALIVMQVCSLTSCKTKSYESNQQAGKIGFLGLYLDMEYSKVKSTVDSLLKISELQYFETADILGNKQKNLYSDFSEISPSLYARVNLRATLMVDERLTSIQLTLCNRSDTGELRFLPDCDLDEIKRIFELYKEEYGEPTLIGLGKEYDLLVKRISGVYSTGQNGRWAMDKIYFWEKGNYIIYFDFGYPGSQGSTGETGEVSGVYEPPDSTSAPIIYYDFTQDYIDVLLDKASRMKEAEFKIQRPDSMR